jgi:beta-galactosidase
MKQFSNTLMLLLIFQTVMAGKFTSGETLISLNGMWQFKKDPHQMGENSKWFTSDLKNVVWDKMEVPGSWELENEYSTYVGKAWYRTTFKTPDFTNKRVFLEFGAVSMNYKVYLNDIQIANILVGNYKERFDISNLMKNEGVNTLAVEVDNSLRWFAYCNWGGIRRPVNISIVDPVFVERQEIVAQPDLKNGTASINVKVFIRNSSSKNENFKCSSNIFFDKKVLLKTDSKTINIPPNSELTQNFNFNLSKTQTKLWHFDRPNLYTSEIEIFNGKERLNSYADRFGIRKIEIDGFHFKLNGESVRLAGFNWLADDRTTGNTLPQWRYKEDIDRMKSLGANMARLSHRPLPEEVLDYIDEKGILVVSEFNNWNWWMHKDQIEPQIFASKLIHEQYNHPCVVGWSVGNENGNYKENVDVNAYTESIIKFIKQKLDSSRFVLYVSNTADFQKNDAAVYGDFIMINKYNSYEKAIDSLKVLYPHKPVFMSEYGSHSVNLIYDTPNKTVFPSLMVNNLTSKENLFGFSIWTFNDYRSLYQSTNPLTSTPLSQNRQWGVVDVYRNKKRSYAQMRNFYAPIRKLNVISEISNESNVLSTINLQPRKSVDIPAYELENYRIVWEVKAKNGSTEQGGAILLPNIKPGDKALSLPFTWKKSVNSALLKVTLLSPLGYSVKDTTLYYAPASAPKVIDVIPAANSVRVVFERNCFATEYALKYSVNGKTKTTTSTIDHYIDLSDLTAGNEYEISVVGMNDFGEGIASEPTKVMIKNGYQMLPPVIWLAEPCNNGFFIGQSFAYNDSYYETRYGNSLENKDEWKMVSASNFGMFKISNLENGKKYYFQVRRVSYGLCVKSEWSEVHEITPSPYALVGKASINGLINSDNEIITSINPAKNASSYLLSYQVEGKKIEELIDRSEIDYYHLQKSKGKKVDKMEIIALP